MSRRLLTTVGLAALWMLAVAAPRTPAQEAYDWRLPNGFPPPRVPADNPMSEAKVELGRHLFYDTRLSGNGTQSCASCHEQAKAFTDGRARSVGSTGEVHPRGSMSLVNVAYARVLNWGDPNTTRLEDQALIPMYGREPVELGLDSSDTWLESLAADPAYRRLFADAFPGDATPATRANVGKALATFQRAIVSARSPYDRYHFDRQDDAISAAARRGEMLFHSRPLSCFTCHGGVHFSAAMGGRPDGPPVDLHNTGLYNLPGPLPSPPGSLGAYEHTRDMADIGKFKPPTLRNIAVTAPYMHDGSVATLEDVIAHYGAGGRARGPHSSPHLRSFSLTADQQADLIAFLESLTDEALLHDPRFANPWAPSR